MVYVNGKLKRKGQTSKTGGFDSIPKLWFFAMVKGVERKPLVFVKMEVEHFKRENNEKGGRQLSDDNLLCASGGTVISARSSQQSAYQATRIAID